MSKINIAIAEDHLLVRQGLVTMLKTEKRFNVLFHVENGKDLLECIKIRQPDVILLDIRMPIMDGKETLDIIHKIYPNIKVIIISMHHSDGYIREFIKAGASGFLPKNCDIEKLIEIIISIYEERYCDNDEFSKTVLDRQNKRSQKNEITMEVSEREITVIKLLCTEKNISQIAKDLQLSPRTIEWHKKNIYDKTNSKNLVGLVMYAIKNNIIKNPGEAFN